MQDQVQEIQTHFYDFIVDVHKFLEKDNMQAARRARKSLLKVQKLSKIIRKNITNRKKELQ